MTQYLSHFNRWAPVAARFVFAGIFLHSAWYKIPGSESAAAQVGTAEAVGIPLPVIAVFLAFALETLASMMLILGWHTRLAAAALIVFLVLIAAFFVRDLADQQQLTIFFNCLGLIAGLLYTAAYGAQHAAIRKDVLPS